MNGNGQKNRYSQYTPLKQTVQTANGYRTQQKPSAKPQVPIAFWVVFSVVLVLLVLSLITMTVLLFTVEADKGSSGSSKNETVDRDSGNKSDENVKNDTSSEKNPYKSANPLPYKATERSRENYSLSVGSDATIISNEIKSENAVLIDLNSYKVIAAKNAEEQIYPASMTKVMTLLIGCEQIVKQGIALEELLTVKQEHLDYQDARNASGDIGLVAGDQVTVENLLYLMNYRSETIACLLIAERVAGSEAAFVTMMNQKAKDLGLNNTNFVNCTGLHENGHYTSCVDMAVIMAYALDNPMAKTVLSSYKGRNIPIYKDNSTKAYRSPEIYSGWYSNRLGDNPNAGGGITIKGGKTGYETEPYKYYTFVTYAQDSSGNTYICVTANDTKLSENAQSTRTVYKNYAK